MIGTGDGYTNSARFTWLGVDKYPRGMDAPCTFKLEFLSSFPDRRRVDLVKGVSKEGEGEREFGSGELAAAIPVVEYQWF